MVSLWPRKQNKERVLLLPPNLLITLIQQFPTAKQNTNSYYSIYSPHRLYFCPFVWSYISAISALAKKTFHPLSVTFPETGFWIPYNSSFYKKCVAAKTFFTDKDGNNISLSSLLGYQGPIPKNLKTREGFGQCYRLPSGDQVLMKEYYTVWFVCFYPVESTSCRPQDFFDVLAILIRRC